MEEFPQRRAAAPARDAFRAGDFAFVEFADERRQDVRALQIVVVVRPVEIGRHGADEIAAVLSPKGLAQFDPGDFCHRVPLIGRLQRPAEQGFLFYRLRGVLRINAGTAQEQ